MYVCMSCMYVCLVCMYVCMYATVCRMISSLYVTVSISGSIYVRVNECVCMCAFIIVCMSSSDLSLEARNNPSYLCMYACMCECIL